MLRNLTLALVALAVWASLARPDDSDAMTPEEGAVHVMLLRQKSVREALKLSDDEAKQIKAHNNQQWKKAQEIQKMSSDERHKRYEELAKDNERFIGQVLDPSERKRLDEISLQTAGLLLATSPKIASQLGLTDRQKDELKRHQKEARSEMAKVLHSRTTEGRDQKLHELRATSRKRLMDVLTDEQETRWKEMTGAPFSGTFQYDPVEEG